MRSLGLVLVFGLCAPLTALSGWVLQTTPVGTNINFRAVHVVSKQVVWIGGSQATFLRTTNNGRTWESGKLPGPSEQDFRGLYAFDARNAVLVSAGEAEKNLANIYRTEDGGKSWRCVFSSNEPGVFLDGVAFWDRKNGLVFGDPLDGLWYLLRTKDGGKSWQRLRPLKLPPILPGEAAFAASNSSMVTQGRQRVWIASGGTGVARVFFSTDRGHTWAVSETPILAGPSSGIFGLRFLNRLHGIAVGGDYEREKEAFANVVVTRDGGRTWQKSAATVPSGLKESVVWLPDSSWLAVGPDGSSLKKLQADSWQPVGVAPFHAISRAGDNVWAVGARGTVAKWQGLP